MLSPSEFETTHAVGSVPLPSQPGAGSASEVWLSAEPACVASARAHVALVLREWGVDDDCVDDATLLVSELAANVVEHTRAKTFGVRLEAAPTRVTVAVEESTISAVLEPGDHPLTDFDPRPLPAPAEIGGRGLQILDSLAASWGISRTHRRTSTWFALHPLRPLPLHVVNPDAAAELAAAQAGLRRTQLLLRLTEHLAAAITATEVGDVVTGDLADHLGAVFIGIALVEPDSLTSPTPTMRYLDLSALPQQTREHWARFPLDSDVPVAVVARTGNPEFHEHPAVADTEHPGLAGHMATAGTGAIANLPLLADGVCLGSLSLAWSEPRTLDADTRALLTIVAGYTALALTRRGAASDTVARARRRLVDARVEFDAALEQGLAMQVLTRLDDEVRRAAAAVTDAARRENHVPRS